MSAGPTGETRIRVIYLDRTGDIHHSVTTTSQVLSLQTCDSAAMRAGVNAYFSMLGGYTVLSVQLEVLSEYSFEPELAVAPTPGLVLQFPRAGR
jgi:hypothetical protein